MSRRTSVGEPRAVQYSARPRPPLPAQDNILALTLALCLSAAPAAPARPLWTLVTRDQGFVAFDGEYPFSESIIEVGKARIRLLIAAGPLPVGRDAVRSWVEAAAKATALYYGRFPNDDVTITVLPGGHGHVFGGMTFAGRTVRINVGREATAASMAADWRLPHELLHLAFVDLDDQYLYLEEGLATYVEPIIRAQAGQISDARVWGDFLDGMPNGAPSKGDRGMDTTHSWGNLYWGGARFWLLVDLEIRQRTLGKKSLRDALRGILDEGGDGKVHLELARMLTLGDSATGTTVLQDLHARMGLKSEPAELDALWKKLGVEQRAGTVVFQDDAPLAAVRKAITRPAR